MSEFPDISSDIAYLFDGTLEGLFSAIFASYARKEFPADIHAEGTFQPRLGERISHIDTNQEHALRVKRGIIKSCGNDTYQHILRASASAQARAPFAIYQFVRYAMDDHRGKGKAISNISHPCVSALFEIERSVNNECEHMRQFARFEYLKDDRTQVWFAKINPRDAVVPFVMGHFIERFSIQPFIIYDEIHHTAGVWDGTKRLLVDTDGLDIMASLPAQTPSEHRAQTAWRTFYRAVSIDERYHPELRRHFMPMRLWENITEMKEETSALAHPNHPSSS